MQLWTTRANTQVIQLLAGRSNSYLVLQGGRAVLVDTGWKHARSALIALLDRLLPTSGALAALVLTHAHFDHAENAARIVKEYSVPVYVQREEATWLSTGDNPLPRGTNPITRWLTDHFARRLEPYCRYEPVAPGCIVDKELDLAPLGFDAVLTHTPGHSPGSLSVIVDREFALVGDTMYGVFPGTAFPPFADDPKQLFASWKRLLDTGCKLFLPGHGSARTRELVARKLASIPR